MTPACARYLAIYDAAVAAGGVLAELARAMIDAATIGGSLESNAAGVEGHWRAEFRRELRLRTPGNAQQPTDNLSEGARMLHSALTRY